MSLPVVLLWLSVSLDSIEESWTDWTENTKTRTIRMIKELPRERNWVLHTFDCLKYHYMLELKYILHFVLLYAEIIYKSTVIVNLC